MSDQLKWYVVRAISGKEKKVKQYLDAEVNRLGISHLVPQVLIPTEKYYQMRDGKKIAKERNFFPGYVLIEAALDGELEHVIKISTVLSVSWVIKLAMPSRFAKVKLTAYWARLTK